MGAPGDYPYKVIRARSLRAGHASQVSSAATADLNGLKPMHV